MDYDYWDEKSLTAPSAFLTQTTTAINRQATSSTVTSKLLAKLSPNSIPALRQARSVTILSPTSSLPRSSPPSSLGDFENNFSGGSDGDIQHSSCSDFQYISTYSSPPIENRNISAPNMHFDDSDDFREDDSEEHLASISLMRHMAPIYDDGNNSSINNNDEMTDINADDIDKDDNFRYIFKMTSRPYQYSLHYQPAQGHSYVKVAKLSSLSNGMSQSPSSSSSPSPYSTSGSATSVHHSVPLVSLPSSTANYRIRQRALNGYANHHHNSPPGSSSSAMIYETAPNSVRRDHHTDNHNGYTVEEYGNLACGSFANDNQHAVINGHGSEALCAVCGDGHAKLHYGVLACYGCKGFFRRTLTGRYQYACRFGSNCIVDKYQRNSCRYCRFKRCIDVGMDPKAVRPDRDLTGKQRVPRARKRQIDEELINHIMRLQGDDWSRKIPVEAKVLLMQLLNIESKVSKGDIQHGTSIPSSQAGGTESFTTINEKSVGDGANNSKNVSLRELFEQKPSLNGRRTEMCYEPYRMARPEELPRIGHRSAIAAVDWVESLSEIGDFCDTEDKVALVKSCYAPLTIFNFSARTAQNTKDQDILCLCSYSFVPRKLPPEFNATNHLSNVLIDRTLNELVAPLRKLNLREEEVVPLKTIIILNPNAKGLSLEAQQKVAELRDRIQDMLFQIVKEMHPAYNASSRFGNLLLLLPTITTLSSVMSENVQFTQVFGNRTGVESLLNELFEDNNSGKLNSAVDEPLITSSTSTLTPSPLFENPADISLQSIILNPSIFVKASHLNNKSKTSATRADGCTQTEQATAYGTTSATNSTASYFQHCAGTGSGDNCCSPLNTNLASAMTNSFCPTVDENGFSSPTHSRHHEDDPLNEVTGLNSFGSSFDESSLLDDCELADSSTFSPEIAAQLFESSADLFALMQ